MLFALSVKSTLDSLKTAIKTRGYKKGTLQKRHIHVDFLISTTFGRQITRILHETVGQNMSFKERKRRKGGQK